MKDADPLLRWFLVDEHHDDGDRPVGVCVEVDGLFADEADPAVERWTLHGWTATTTIGPGPLGEVALTAGNRENYLQDVTVVEVAGETLVLEGRVHPSMEYLPDEEHPDVPEIELRRIGAGEAELLGTFRTATGLYRERPEYWPPDVTLIGFRPEPWLREEMRHSEGKPVTIRATVIAQDSDGRMIRTSISGLHAEIAEVRPSVHGGDLLDVALDDGFWEPMPVSARHRWTAWLDSPPRENGTWASLDPAGRVDWILMALNNHSTQPEHPPGQTYRLEGRHVTEIAGFFCAMGEAINGPGGYYGWGEHAFDDCLSGPYFGAKGPFRLIWTDFAVARQHCEGLDDVLALLAKHNVEVIQE
ncbi:barstar family protein [Actinoplanes rectilineatus]|uniref:barstar family protein n=1 Tax=Actinoplanes rectilineatus TaxID=113571 RepID=UPI0006972A03|nr:barstar family protein [Actinoplanes rectilineatus]